MSGGFPEVLLATKRGINIGAGEGCIVGVRVGVKMTVGVSVTKGKSVKDGVAVSKGVDVPMVKGVWDTRGERVGVGLGEYSGELNRVIAIAATAPMIAIHTSGLISTREEAFRTNFGSWSRSFNVPWETSFVTESLREDFGGFFLFEGLIGNT
jgi:hypothetical protein